MSKAESGKGVTVPQGYKSCERCGQGTVVWDFRLKKGRCSRCGSIH